MSFPIQLIQAKGAYDLFACAVNVPLNGAVVVIGGSGLLSVSSFVLDALGFEGAAATVARAVPVVYKTTGAAGVVTLGCFALLLAHGVRTAIGGHRYQSVYSGCPRSG